MKTLTEFSQVALRRAAVAHQAAVANGLEGDALAEALQTQLAIPAERVPRVLEALEIVGDGIEKISLVRVFQGETGPQGATSKGEFHYVVNRAAAPKTSGAPARRDRDGDRGGKGKGDKRGSGGPGGGGPGGPRNDKPRGLGSLKAGGSKDSGAGGTERVNFAEIPRAGMGWQWTRAPRDPNDTRPDRPRRGPPGRRPGGGPGGRGPGGRGPGGPGGAGRPGGGGGRGPGGPRGAAPNQDNRPAAAPVAAPAAEATAANQE